MAVIILKSPSVARFMHFDSLFKWACRFYQKLRSTLSGFVSCSLSLYTFFVFFLKRNNSLFNDKELFPIGQKTHSREYVNVLEQTRTRSWKYVNVLGQTGCCSCKNAHVLWQTETHLWENVNVLRQTGYCSYQYVK